MNKFKSKINQSKYRLYKLNNKIIKIKFNKLKAK